MRGNGVRFPHFPNRSPFSQTDPQLRVDFKGPSNVLHAVAARCAGLHDCQVALRHGCHFAAANLRNTCRQAGNEQQTALTARPWVTRASEGRARNPLFFASVLHSLPSISSFQKSFCPVPVEAWAISARAAASSDAATASPADTAVSASWRSSFRHRNTKLAATPSCLPTSDTLMLGS